MGLNLRKLGSKIFDQVNPFDNGRTYQQRTPTNNRSVVQQAVNSGASNVAQGVARNAVRAYPQAVKSVGRVIAPVTPVDDIVRGVGNLSEEVANAVPEISPTSPARFLNSLAIRPYKTTQGNFGQALQGQNPYEGSARQQAGQFTQDVINASSVLPVGKAASLATKGAPLGIKVLQGAKLGAKMGGGFGAAQGVSTSLQDELSIPEALKTTAVNTVAGTALGAGLGVAAPVLGKGITVGAKGALKGAKVSAKATQDAIQAARATQQPLGESGAINLPFGRKQNLSYSSTNGSTSVSGKAGAVRRKIAELNNNEVGAVGRDVRGFSKDNALKNDPNVMWHGSPSGELKGSSNGLHIGSHPAAKQALEARIGIRADGKDWSGSSEYGKTLLAGSDTLKKLDPKGYNQTGFNVGENFPKKDFYIKDHPELKAKFADGTPVRADMNPAITPVKIKGSMSNHPTRPMEDFRANGVMSGQIKRGTAKRGYYYSNVGEDVGSISAVVPNKSHVEVVKSAQSNKPKLRLKKLNEGGTLGDNNQPTIKNVFGEDVPNPNYQPKTSQPPKVALKQETAPQAPVPENNLVDSLPNNNIASEQQIAKALGMSDQQLKQAQLDSVPPQVEAPKLPVATRPKPTVETKTSAPKEPLQYVEGQQALEKLAGNKTQEQLLADGNLTTGGSGIIPRVPTKVNKPIDVTADAVTGGTNNLLGKALRNQNPIVNMVGQIAYGLNRKSTLTNAEKSLVEQVQGRQGGIGSLSDDIQQTLEAPLKNLDEPTMAASKEKVFEAFLKHNAGDIPTSKAIIESFSPEERQYFDKVRELNKIRNELNRGQMADEVIAKGDEGMHMPRLYQFDESQGMTDDIEAYALSQNKTLDLNPAKRRKQLEDIAEELQSRMLRDPAQAAVIRTEIALHNRAIGQYSATIGKIANAVSDTNKRGYLQIPDSPKYGELSGKFVRKDLSYPILGRGDRLESQTSKAASELMDKWQAGVFGKIEDGLRQLLTVFNPATRLGNRGANIVQSQLSGFNIPEAAARQQHYMNVLKRGGDEMTRLAKTYGAIDDTDALAKFSGVQRQSKGMRGKLQKSYQNTDAGAKVAMFEWQLKKGATPQEAARFVNRALPNIGNSGEIYQFFSRLPVLGIPFRAIQPEVFRALGSAAGRHPVALISAMAAYSAFQSFTWEDVPEEERKQIQTRFGAGNTPFAKLNEFTESNSLPNTSKVLPTTWAFNAGKFMGDKGNIYEVDPRRLAGIYSLNTSPGDTSGGLLDEAKKVSPAPIPFRAQDGKLTFQPQELVGSRTFSTPYQMLIDRDFRGKSIQDPEGKIYNPDGTISYKYVDKETGKPTFKKDPARLAEFLARGYVTQTGDVENIRDAKKGNKNFYGQDMTVAQAGLRLAALKGERFTPERLKEMRQNDAYYAEKKEIDDMVKDKSPATQERFKRLTGYYKLREKVANEFKPGEERDKKAPVFNFAEDKWKEYTSDPELYDLMMEKKKKENKRQGSPIPPEFDERLSSEFRKQLINNKSLAPGEDAEADGKMYAHAEWDKYEGIRKEYDDKAKKYYPQRKDGEFNDELVKHKSAEFPEKPPAKKAYDDAYALYSQGKGPKPAYNDAVDAGKTAYNQAKLDWTNAERKARGLVAISPEEWNNATFGFQSDEEKVYKELKYAKGYGKNGYGGGSGGGSSSTYGTNNPYEYAIKLKSSGGIPKPKVKAVASKKVKASGKVGKIKVSSKKSLV